MMFLFAYESLHHCRTFDCKNSKTTSCLLYNQQLNIHLLPLLRYLHYHHYHHYHHLDGMLLKWKKQLQSLQATATKKDNIS